MLLYSPDSRPGPAMHSRHARTHKTARSVAVATPPPGPASMHAGVHHPKAAGHHRRRGAGNDTAVRG
eukprot:2875058-Pyramimonas_sp.AAC.2